MKKSLFAAPALILILVLAPLALAAPAAAPSINADGVCVIDGASGAVVYSENPHKRFPMASVTKVMTAVLAIEKSDIKQKVVVDVSWDEIPDSSIMGLDLMEELTIEQLLYGLMLPSGNDAARAIARSIAGDDYRFAEMMNQKAQELGLVDTHYKNPHGRDEDGHYTSACDLATLGRYAMRYPEFRQIVATKRISFDGRFGAYNLRNINRFLLNYPGADGIKTGYDDLPNSDGVAALSSVIATAERDGRRGYVAILHSYGDYAAQAATMMDFFFNN
ncbi:MAG: serine hydrolase [Chloroflexi bacterium]|nr:serine hydrolase [Chloroflexota bacterium]